MELDSYKPVIKRNSLNENRMAQDRRKMRAGLLSELQQTVSKRAPKSPASWSSYPYTLSVTGMWAGLCDQLDKHKAWDVTAETTSLCSIMISPPALTSYISYSLIMTEINSFWKLRYGKPTQQGLDVSSNNKGPKPCEQTWKQISSPALKGSLERCSNQGPVS